MSSISSFPGTPALFLNADNVDGFDNALVAHAGDVSSWKAEGSAGLANFAAVGPDAPTRLRANPYMKKSSAEEEVSFDGVFDQLSSPGSASQLNFIHTTGVFDLFLVFRRRSSGSNRRLFGCSGGATQKGLQVFQQIDGAGVVDGGISANLANASGLIVSADSSLVAELGGWSFFLIRGTGTQLQITKDFYFVESTAFTGALATGDAFADYHLGSIADTMVTPSLFEGDMRLLALYSTNLSTQQCIAFKATAAAQLGVSL